MSGLLYLIITNNIYRQIKVENISNISQKKSKTIIKFYYNFSSTYICIITTIVKSTIIISIIILSILINAKNSKKNNCFIYYKHKYLIQNYSNYNTRAIIIKKSQVSFFLEYNL